ncbi:serine/threonine-protein kinase prpf4B-like [Plodia interpunctella]|uniref:serine/threonine-protein kinase prpf4B-like n=1 Tax=Plodia interpunctella TaxID=58824 RepID=UPI00236822E9|nr:serine/threonine-protein kinase prpf4B-like [Plodia interpunctella]
MEDRLKFIILLVFKLAFGKELDVDLPLCPTDIQFLPQSLPMHCRLPRNANFASFDGEKPTPTLPPYLAPFYQSPAPSKVPFPMPPGFPGYPGMQLSGAAPSIVAPLPAPPPALPGVVPARISPIQVSGPAHKLPVIVMPFYSPDKSFRSSQRPAQSQSYSDDPDTDSSNTSSDDTSSDTDTSSDSDTQSDHSRDRDHDRDHERGRERDRDSDDGWWKSKRGFRRSSRRHSAHKHRGHRMKKKWPREIITPILQYVNDNGYVIFEKKISKVEAKEWLNGENGTSSDGPKEFEEYEEKEKEVYDNKVEGDKKENHKSKTLHRPASQHHKSEEKTHSLHTKLINIEPAQPQIVKKHHKHQNMSSTKYTSKEPKSNAKDAELSDMKEMM